MRFSLLILILSMTVLAKAEVAFLTDYKRAQAASAASGKPIFLDAYTTWCAPCKKMEQEVFTDPGIKTLLEEDFIPLRLDMEKEPGLTLARQLNVAYYPTLLVLNEGKELHRSVGFLDVVALTAFAKTSLNPTQQGQNLIARFKEGDRTSSFLKELLAYAKTANLAAYETYALAYLRATNGWASPEGQELIVQGIQSVSTPLFDTLVSQQGSLSQRFGEQIVTDRIARMVDEYLFGETPAKPRKAKKLIRRAYPMDADSTFIRYQMRRAREAGKAKKFGKYAVKWQQKYPTTDPYELEELIYVFEQKLPGWRIETVDAWRARKEELQAAEGSW